MRMAPQDCSVDAVHATLNRAGGRTIWRFGLPVWELLDEAADLAGGMLVCSEEHFKCPKTAWQLQAMGQPWLLLAAQVPLARLRESNEEPYSEPYSE